MTDTNSIGVRTTQAHTLNGCPTMSSRMSNWNCIHPEDLLIGEVADDFEWMVWF